MLILGQRVTAFRMSESNKRWYNRQLFQQRAPLFVQIIPSRRSKLFPSPTLLGYASASFAQWKTGETSGGHFESLTAVNIYEVLNTIVSYRILLCGTAHYRLCTLALGGAQTWKLGILLLFFLPLYAEDLR